MENGVQVSVRALNCTNNGNGTFTLELPARPLTPEQNKVLDELFRHTYEQMETLLAQEALIESVVSEREAQSSDPYSRNTVEPVKKGKTPRPESTY